MSGSNDDRARILARRARFVAAALAASVAPHAARAQSGPLDEVPDCEKDPDTCRPQICLSDDIIEGELERPKPKPAPQRKAAPRVCLSVMSETEDRPQRHDGWYLRLALGGGYLGMSQRGDRGGRSVAGTAAALSLDFGPTIDRGLVSGIGATLMHAPAAGYDPGDAKIAATFVLLGPALDFYPDPVAGFHVGGRLGPAISVLAKRSGAANLVATGIGGSAFVGLDGFVANAWSVGFVLEGSAAAGAGSADDQRETNVSRGLTLKLSLLWH